MRTTQTAALSLFIFLSARPCAAQEQPAEISGRELGRRALEITLAYVKDKDPDVRGMAAEVLGQAGNRSAAGILKKLLADPDRHTRINAAEALWKLGDPSGLKTIYAIIGDEPAKAGEGDSPLAELRIISRNKVREHAIEAFARMKGDKAGTMLYELKNDRFGTIRDAAARELARLGYAEEMTQFLDATGSEDEGIRFQGASILASICSPAAAERLAALLAPNESMRVRIAALDGIKCSGGGKAAVQALLRLADDPNPTLRFKAVNALGSVRDGKAFEKLKEIYGASPDISLRIAAVKGIAAGGGIVDPAVLHGAFDSADPEVRKEALKAAYLVSDADAKKCFSAGFADGDPAVRLEAALQVLKRFGKPRDENGRTSPDL